MGFLQAICSMGEMANQKYLNSPLSDIMSYLQLPYPMEEPEDRRTQVIRVWLEVADAVSESLDVRGVKHVDPIDYQAIGAGETELRERCLYREPVGSNVRWRFSPLLRLGKAPKDPKAELVGNGWEDDTNSRFYKLKQNVLSDLERTGCFTPGSVDRILAGLSAKVERISELWSNRKRSYMLLLGIGDGECFLYPGEITAFVNYFRSKLETVTKKSKGKELSNQAKRCSLCGNKTDPVYTLDKIFSFATFDKESFLPGIKASAGVTEKVFPICGTCFGKMSAGMENVENGFVDHSTVPGVSLYIVPEIISGNSEYFQMAADYAEEFLAYGVKHEKRLFDYLARQGEGLVYHFMFAEKNQAQLIVHYLIEDVPPTRLRQLQDLWLETCAVFRREAETGKSDKPGLNSAIRQIVAILFSLAGKSNQEKMVMREKGLAVIAALLNGERIRTNDIKALTVSRFPGLFSDPEWIRPKRKQDIPGRLRLKGMAEIVDYLTRVNRRREI
ncbi:MAG: TM1802 family CRISPR-associated protein [bacterium]